ncbi:MAG: hypothetical protein IKG21_09230 [Atopobiaceae bacterium]|nr:hypothetical protein [Atopobiaceae bacterium]
MRTIALKFHDNAWPLRSMFDEHQFYLSENGFTWWGKTGVPISDKVASEVLASDDPRVLLIHSGEKDRWWAHVDQIVYDRPNEAFIPSWYHDNPGNYSCWLRITQFEPAPKDVMSWCLVASSKKPLFKSSSFSRSNYFIIDYFEGSEGRR